ncbi:MAG: acetylxylan esterase [Lentisphaeria bacterium]|nr:acetylxylan esterase [Lentisphaeria bacterium]
MKKISQLAFAILLVSGFPTLLKAELKLAAECTRESALFKAGEEITFRTTLTKEDGSPECGREVQYILKGDGGFLRKGKFTSAEKPQELTARLDRPGFVLLTVTAKGEKKTLRTWAGAGVDPEQIQPGTPDTPDFDDFWQGELKALRARKIEAKLEPVADPRIRFGVKVCKVQLDNGELRANGYLLIPPDAKPKKLPLTIMFNGASAIGASYAAIDSMTAQYKTLVFVMNLHDTPVDIPRKDWQKWRQSDEIRDYMYRDTGDPKKYYIFKIFSRVVLSLEYLKTRPEWNGRTIIARGGSLGGAQALAAAYFEPKTVLCIANAPALSDHFGADRNQNPGWPDLFERLKKDPEALAAARKTMRYFDTVNFARRIKCQVAMSTGFIDTVCPPTTGYAVYNTLPGKKSIVNVTLGTHGLSLKKGEPSVFSCGGNYVRELCRKVEKGN